jgi:hypothetical protein
MGSTLGSAQGGDHRLEESKSKWTVVDREGDPVEQLPTMCTTSNARLDARLTDNAVYSNWMLRGLSDEEDQESKW